MAKLENPTWAVGITTAPRRDPSIAGCLNSIIEAGWNESIFVFAEPGSPDPDVRHPGMLRLPNEKKRGCWHNWLYSAQWLLNNTESESIMTVQDDGLFHPDSKAFAESIMWPSDRTGFLSLYTPKHYTKSGVHRVSTSSLWGTVAVIWPREVLQQVVGHRLAQTWMGIRHAKREIMKRREKDQSLINNADYVIGKIVNALRLEMWFITPSPVSHASKVSTINHGGNSGRRNCRPCADHDTPLADQVGASTPEPRPSLRTISSRKGARVVRQVPRSTLFHQQQMNRLEQIQSGMKRLRESPTARRRATRRRK